VTIQRSRDERAAKLVALRGEYRVAPGPKLGAGRMLELSATIDQVRKTPSWPRSWPTSAFYSCIPTGMYGPTCIVWADLTPFALQSSAMVGTLPGDTLVEVLSAAVRNKRTRFERRPRDSELPEAISGAEGNILTTDSRCNIFLGPQITFSGPRNRARRFEVKSLDPDFPSTRGWANWKDDAGEDGPKRPMIVHQFSE
jgi:hypothetical protein